MRNMVRFQLLITTDPRFVDSVSPLNKPCSRDSAPLQDTAQLVLDRSVNLPPGKNVPFCSVGGHLIADPGALAPRGPLDEYRL